MKMLMQKIREQPPTTARQRAEALVRAAPASAVAMTDEDAHRLLFELQVHYVELQLQNEELRIAQLALAATRDRYVELYEFAPVGFLTLNHAGVVIETNLTAATMVGVARARLMGSRFSDFVAPASQDTAHFYWQNVFSAGGRQVAELELQRFDGTLLTVRLEGIRFDSPFDPAPQCRVAMMDTSDLKHSRDSLSALNDDLERRIVVQVSKIKLMANAISNLGEGVMICSYHRDWTKSRIIFANAALCQMVGYTTEELLDQTPSLLLGEKVDAAVVAQLNTNLAFSCSFEGEMLYATRNGSYRDIELLVSPLHDPETETTHIVAVQRDITERKQVRRALHDREQRLQAVLDAAGDAIITFDRTGIIRNCNPVVKRIYGYSADEVVGSDIGMLIPIYQHRQDNDLALGDKEPGEGGGRKLRQEMMAPHRKGHSFPISVSISEIDHLGLYIAVVHDISELRRLQKEVLRAGAEVQWQVGQALHDGPQQALAGLTLLARGLSLDLAREASPHAGAAARMAAGVQRENRAIQSLARGMVPVGVGEGGLVFALERLANRVTDEHDLVCDFKCYEPIQIEDTYTEDQLYLIAQEAVLNAAKHAKPDSIRISLGRCEDTISMQVVDDGAGINGVDDARHGLGLHIMPHRAATIGATLTISDAAEGGTVIDCRLPAISA